MMVTNLDWPSIINKQLALSNTEPALLHTLKPEV